jgi:hypothetical protein
MEIMIPKVFEKYLYHKKSTLLAVGPMSKNCVDATIEMSNSYKVPIILIASRRQIDSAAFGGGYVNEWDTSTFSKYVKKKDKNNLIFLARDHGGPWQNNVEKQKKYNLKDAMSSAKESFKCDIDSGFKFIHIDTSMSLNGSENNKKKCMDRLFEFYEFCHVYAKKKKKDIFFEIGTEEQSGTTNTKEELEETLNKTINFCNKNKFKKPTFVVIQSGTRVMEMKNVGSFDLPFRVKNEVPAEIQVPQMINICKKYNILMKEHNTDYLSNEALSWHPKLGIHAANVAPEFGVIETRAIIKIVDELRLKNLKERLLNISLNSGKWKKWMIKDSGASDYDKSLIAGHYVFSNPEFTELKDILRKTLKKKKNLDLDTHLKNEIKKTLFRYLQNFKII